METAGRTRLAMASRMAKRQPGGGDVVVMVDCGLSGFVEGGRTVGAVYSNFLFATLARSSAEKGKAADQLGISVVLLPRWCIHATYNQRRTLHKQIASQSVNQSVRRQARQGGILYYCTFVIITAITIHFCYSHYRHRLYICCSAVAPLEAPSRTRVFLPPCTRIATVLYSEYCALRSAIQSMLRQARGCLVSSVCWRRKAEAGVDSTRGPCNGPGRRRALLSDYRPLTVERI
jgi:hypothetical protein